MSGWNGKNTVSVVGSGIIASVAAPGAVYCAEKLLPSQMHVVKNLVAEHVVYPQLGFFEALSGNLNKAHEKHDREKRAEQQKSGGQFQPLPHYTPRQRAYNIADTLVQAGTALGTDFAGAYGLMKLFNYIDGVKLHAGKTAFVDMYVTLGCLAVMPTLLAGISENFHHSLRHTIQKITGMSSDSADKLAMSSTYVAVPSLAGLIASTVAAGRR